MVGRAHPEINPQKLKKFLPNMTGEELSLVHSCGKSMELESIV
jgi:hypothetical protein